LNITTYLNKVCNFKYSNSFILNNYKILIIYIVITLEFSHMREYQPSFMGNYLVYFKVNLLFEAYIILNYKILPIKLHIEEPMKFHIEEPMKLHIEEQN